MIQGLQTGGNKGRKTTRSANSGEKGVHSRTVRFAA